MAALRRTRRGRNSDREMLVRVMLIGAVVLALLFIASRVLPPLDVPQIQPPQAQQPPVAGPAVYGANYSGTFNSFEPFAKPSSFYVTEGKKYTITFRSANTNGIPGWAGDLLVYPDTAARPGTCTGPANPMWVVEDGEVVQRNYGVSGAWETPLLFADMGEGRVWQGLMRMDSVQWGPGFANAEGTAVASAVLYLRNGDSKLSDNSGCASVEIQEVGG